MSSWPTCTACGTASGGAFCPQCGACIPGGAGGSRDRRVWLVAGLVSVAAAGAVAWAVVRREPAPAPSGMTNVGSAPLGAAPPLDLAGLSPEARFAQLFDRLMRAGAEWDSSTVATLSPLAVAAYAALDSVDTDTRFHAGLLAIQIGNFAGAHALADTIEATTPGHLFAPILVGALARLETDTLAYRRAIERFRERVGPELARSDRPEYTEHRQLLTEVQQAAETQ